VQAGPGHHPQQNHDLPAGEDGVAVTGEDDDAAGVGLGALAANPESGRQAVAEIAALSA